jgi:hypothetical protein
VFDWNEELLFTPAGKTCHCLRQRSMNENIQNVTSGEFGKLEECAENCGTLQCNLLQGDERLESSGTYGNFLSNRWTYAASCQEMSTRLVWNSSCEHSRALHLAIPHASSSCSTSSCVRMRPHRWWKNRAVLSENIVSGRRRFEWSLRVADAAFSERILHRWEKEEHL